MLRVRFITLIVFFIIAAILLVLRLVDLSIRQRAFLLKQSKARILRTVDIPAYRGMITDRRGQPISMSAPVDSVWINPQAFHPDTRILKKLARLLHMNSNEIIRKSHKYKYREFVYLKRNIPPTRANNIKLLNIEGLYFQRGYKRYYPHGEVDSHIIGFTNIDDQGQEGLELGYNQWLAGHKGQKQILKDRLGHVIADVADLKKPKPGHDLQLSIDQRLQYVAYYHLKKTIKQYAAQSGSIVILDTCTGEILAMVNQPSYNPNNRSSHSVSAFRNRAVTDTFEPGSTIKPFNLAYALESRRYTPNTVIDTHPGWIMIDGHEIRDEGFNHGKITLTQLLQKSSNVGAAKIMLSLSAHRYRALLYQAGFDQLTASGFPGESSGHLPQHRKWKPIETATLAFGYGLTVTPLQLANAYMIFANHGIKRPVTFLKSDQENIPQSQRVISRRTADQLLHMMEKVVQKQGTGRRAKITGYRVAGKTGTAYLAGKHGYSGYHYIASFVGIAPVSHPRLVMSVVIRDPKGEHFGGIVAAPLFSEVMKECLRLLKIAPDMNQSRQR
jgi:cell division protein FtsI (penicillin-binding protein 3)